jgi:hypothetical protein
MKDPIPIRKRPRRRRQPGIDLLARAGVFAVATALAACSSVRLVPVNPANGAEVHARTPTVEVRANADASQRLWTVPSAFTPVRLSIQNTGDAPVYIDLDDIQLAGAGSALEPVPPASIPPRRRVGSLGLDPGSPFVAPQSGGNSVFGRSESLMLGPPLGSYVGPLGHGTSGGAPDILASAFSGGPIERGQTRTGIVYFRHVPADAGHLTLRVGVRSDPDGPAPASVVEIVYAVQRT